MRLLMMCVSGFGCVSDRGNIVVESGGGGTPVQSRESSAALRLSVMT